MHYLLIAILVISQVVNAGCDIFESDVVQSKTVNNISGDLSLSLHKRDAIGLYVNFKLVEHPGDGHDRLITESGFNLIKELPVPFYLVFQPENINQQYKYTLHAIVTEDPEGSSVITTMTSDVLTQGHSSTFQMAIQQPPEPLE